MMIKLLVLFSMLFSVSSYAQEDDKAVNITVEPIEFDRIRQVLEKDRLGTAAEKKKASILKSRNAAQKREVARYDFPKEEDFWGFFSEYWLVKNATILKWNFEKPDYGLESSFKEFLEKIGFYEVKFKILLVNTPDITHFALPSNPNEAIFLLSVPFIRTLDLSKLEISILLLEDFLRLKNGYFKSYASSKELQGLLGSNFYEQKKFDMKVLEKVSSKYDEMIFDKGFNFQQQFSVTEKMGAMLKNNLKFWNGYYLMLGKIDGLVKSNILYQKYLKIYPSPELQRNWLKPSSKKVL